MRLDAPLRDFINETWAEPRERNAVALQLQQLPQALRPEMITVREVGAPESVRITPNVLVVTRDAIGYGWPMREVLWRRS